MILKPFDADKHFEEVSRWWQFWHKKDIFVKELLSDIGYVVENENQLVCAGWLYTSNSCISYLEFITLNPTARKEVRGAALDFLIEKLIQRNLKEGRKISMASGVQNEYLARRLASLGFSLAAQKVKQFIKG